MARTGSPAERRSRAAHMKPCAQAALALALIGGTTLAAGGTIATTRTLRHRGHGSCHRPSRAGFVLATPGSGASSARPRAQGRKRGSWVAERCRRSRGSSQDQGRDWRRQQREWGGVRALEAFIREREPVRHGSGSISATAGDNGDASGDVLSRASGHTARADSEDGDAATAAAGVAATTSTAGATTQNHETTQERYMRRMDTAVRRIWNLYYTTSTSEFKDAMECLEAFVAEVCAALDAGMSSAEITERLGARLLENAQRVEHGADSGPDAVEPMVLYRFWLRGRAVDIHEKDLLHSSRWVELISETKRQMYDARPVSRQGMGTICYPTGQVFEGKVEDLLRDAQEGRGCRHQSPGDDFPTSPGPPLAGTAVDLAAADRGVSLSPGETVFPGNGGVFDAVDVTTVSGLVSLTVGCMDDGLSEEEAVLRRHLRSPDLGNPLLVLATPSPKDYSGPNWADEGVGDPVKARAMEALTEEHLELGERGAMEMMLDRRRSHLDVHLICAAYRKQAKAAREAPVSILCEEDEKILQEMLREASVTHGF